MNKTDYLNIEEASSVTRTVPDVIRRAIKNGLLIPLSITEPDAPILFKREEVEAWINPTRFHELLSTRLKRGPDAAFLGDFPCPNTYRQKTIFNLPFKGQWFVLDGGNMKTSDGKTRNAHFYCEPCYRWACDFIMIHPNDYAKTYIGMGHNEALCLRRRKGQPEDIPDVKCSEPEDDPMNAYWNILNPDGLEPHLNYLYEVEVIAPADGVFMTRDGKIEDAKFETKIERLAQEGVNGEMGFMLDHGNSEISQIAHVLGRTIVVKPGDKVKRGQVLCKVGGRHSGLPHLHWAVRDSWCDYLASGLPVKIAECSVYGEPDKTLGLETANNNYNSKEFLPCTDIYLQRGMIVENLQPNKYNHTEEPSTFVK